MVEKHIFNSNISFNILLMYFGFHVGYKRKVNLMYIVKKDSVDCGEYRNNFI